MKIYLPLLLLALPLLAQRTTITDGNVRNGAGTLANGTAFITPSQQFTTTGGVQVYPITTAITIRSGVLTTSLYPNDATSSPSSAGCPTTCTSYIVRYALLGQATQVTETWLVPTSGSSVNLSAVRRSPAPLPSPTVALSQVTSGGGVAGQCPVLNASLIWVPGTCGSGGGGGAPTDAPYYTSSAVAGLSAEVNLGALSTGILLITVTAGVATPSVAVAGTDYVTPAGSVAYATTAGFATAASVATAATTATSSTTSGLAALASALDHDPVPCPAGQVVNDLSASVALNCITLTAAQVTNSFDKSASNTIAAGTQDFSGAAHTLPAKVGAIGSIPATCTVGEQYFSTSATAGVNIYLCTATNTWTQTTGGGGGGGGNVTQINSDTTAVQTLTKTNDTNVTVTIVDSGAGDHKFNLGWTGTLAAGRLNSTVVESIVNDTNVTGSISAQALTLGWTGTLAKARQNATTAYTDQANTFGAFLQDFSASTFKVPNSAGLSCATTALICYDSTANVYKGGISGTVRTIAALKGSYSDGDCPKYENSSSLLITTGGNCGSTATNPAFSATPTFDLASMASALIQPGLMTANVSSVAFSNKKAGAHFWIDWIQGSTPYTVTYGSVSSTWPACVISPIAGVHTRQEFQIEADGTTVDGLGCTDNSTGWSYSSTVTAQTSVSITAAVHGKGIAPVVACLTNATPARAVLCEWTRSSIGDLVVTFTPAFTGVIEVRQ